MRRKGERAVVRAWEPWGPGHPVAHMIATGDGWLQAWISQACTPWTRLARSSGVALDRIHAIDGGGTLSRAELDALAAVWGVDPADVIASLPDPSPLVE